MTISDDHGIAHEPLLKILNWCVGLRINYEFVFVVPALQMQGYKRQKFLTTTRNVHKSPSNIAKDLLQYVVGVKVSK